MEEEEEEDEEENSLKTFSKKPKIFNLLSGKTF
jgi:hypothetical protein